MADPIEAPVVRNMSAVERSEAQIKTAMKSREHLERWLEESGRTWIVFNGRELVRALPWPEGVQLFMQVIQCYRDHRAVEPSGRTEAQIDATTKRVVDVPVMKSERLEVPELDRAIRYLIGQITREKPLWSLKDPPL